MKYLVSLLIVLCQVHGFGQNDTVFVDSPAQGAEIAFGALDPEIYQGRLINRSLNLGQPAYFQLNGNDSQIHDAFSWMSLYSDISNGYVDGYGKPTIAEMGNNIEKFFLYAEMEFDDLVQPFGLLLHNMKMIDSTLDSDNVFSVVNNQLISQIPEAELYTDVLLKSASVIEIASENGFTEGYLVYDSAFISLSEDVDLIALRLDIGEGFSLFNEQNNVVWYSRETDSTVALCEVEYKLDGISFIDTIQFYLTTNSDVNETELGKASGPWDEVDKYHGTSIDFKVAIKYGCGNGDKIRRPIIIAPPYRPTIQKPSMNKYWYQFNFKNLFQFMSDMGYDVIFLREQPGNSSIEAAGTELAKFIIDINAIKKTNYPDEDWENILMGFSAGGQHARYALMTLEKNHMEFETPHHHTRLFIPFDSPHLGANVPMFTQAIYKDFSLEDLSAFVPWQSLNDPASTDMLMNHIDGSQIVDNGSVFSGHSFVISPAPNSNRVNLTYEFDNNFVHQFTETQDLRKSYPTFPRNIAVSTGSFSKTYEDEYGLGPGDLLFSQNGFGFPSTNLFGASFGKFNRKVYSSKYTTASHATIFFRYDIYKVGNIPFLVSNIFKTDEAYEWDMAQGGYKTEFYQGFATGAAFVLRNSTGFLTGTRHYKDETMFMPLVSALGINPSIWQNNNLEYNLQSNTMMYQDFDIVNSTQSDIFGYPNLAHPNDHFTKTPFEAVCADIQIYDHIKMQQSIDDYSLNNDLLVKIRDFILDEVEASTVYLQNKIIGENHVQTNPPYEYKAWYKARENIVFGTQVSPKTDQEKYIIKPGAHITAYAGTSIELQPGFEADEGSYVFLYPFISACDADYLNKMAIYGESQPQNNSPEKEEIKIDVVLESNKAILQVYPNPNMGEFTIELNETNPQGVLCVYSITGTLMSQQYVNSNKIRINQKFESGIYMLVWQNKESVEKIKVIIE